MAARLLEQRFNRDHPDNQGSCPRGRVLRMHATSLSPAVLGMIGTAGAMVSFEEGHEVLHELADLDVTVKEVDLRMEPECPYVPPNFAIVPENNSTVPRRPVKWSFMHGRER
jgi:hypothetical protein